MKVVRAAIALIHKSHNTVDTLARELVQVLVLAGSEVVSVRGRASGSELEQVTVKV